QVLEERFPEIKETQPELLAHHYTEAGLIAQAIPYWQSAGQRAIQRSANREAISHLSKALELLKTLPDIPERAPQELMLQLTLGVPLMATKGWAAPDVEKAVSRARELCRQLGETPQLFPVLRGLWPFRLMRAEYQMANELGQQGLRLAQSVQDPALLLEAYLMLGMTSLFLGDLIPAREYLEHSIALYNPQQHHAHAFVYGFDPGITGLSYLTLVLWCLGYPDQALKKSQETLALARQLSHPFSLCMALINTAMFRKSCWNGQAVQEQAEEVIAISTEHGFAEWLTMGDIFRGWALAEQGQVQEGISQLRRGLTAYRGPIGAESVVPWSLSFLAEAYDKGEQVEEGLDALAEALGMMQRTGEGAEEAEVYRLQGQLTLKQSGVRSPASDVPNTQHPTPSTPAEAEAEACFLKAIEVARRQQAKSWELRAAMSLSRLWQQQGKQTAARQMLVETYGWFSEGFDTKDLKEAKALLSELA
ncbi:MAG: hypothetical protein HY268_29385, partial [Deltaproteobacteria bacterium]|nr:hypothetical protein [Deltaproteobacteria bacterium]